MEFKQEEPSDWARTVFQGLPMLPHDHCYLRSLRGELESANEAVTKLPVQNNNSETQAENVCSPEMGHTLQTLLSNWSRDWKENMENETFKFSSAQMKGNSNHPELKICCNSCSELISLPCKYFFCRICRVGLDYFDLCENCVMSGKRCTNPDHELELGKGVKVVFNEPVRVPAKAIHSASGGSKARLSPSVDSLNTPHTNLKAVISAYIQQPLITSKPSCRSGRLENLSMYRFVDEIGKSVPDEIHAIQCVRSWRLICHFLAHDHYEPSLLRSLTPEHVSVIKLLLEWWVGDVQDFRLSQMAQCSLLIENFFPATSPDDIATLSGRTRSEYHKALIKLFQLEFDNAPPNPSIMGLQRAEASRYASVQRLGFSCYRGSLVPLWLEPEKNVYQAAWDHLELVSRSIPPSLSMCKEKNARETQRFAVEVLTAYHDSMELAIMNLRSAQQILGPKQLNASAAQCWWISRAERMAHVPYYLWDKQGRQTVRTDSLIHLPEYTVVSHTWGRWKIKGSEDIQLPNVPWKIPQNGRFAVQSLADILERVPGGNRYVWFDLVCIPQSTNDVNLKNIEKQEIAKQAAIFSHAETAIAWFSTMDEFGPLEEICHMLAMNVVRYPGPFTNEQLTECLRRLSTTNAKLVDESPVTPLAQTAVKADQDHRWDDVLDEWFSSLWTLQEACMRPDMWLCTRNWKVLESHASDTPITLDCVLSLVRVNAEEVLQSKGPNSVQAVSSTEALANLVFRNRETHKDVKIMKNPPQCLYNFVVYTSTAALIDIPGIEPIRIITMGNQRKCKRNRRGEAIMAVLGVMNWFKNQSSLPNGTPQLVLDRFPVAFVEEVRQKLGDFVFFSSDIARDFWINLKEDQISMTQIENLKVKGTLLPFSEEGSRDILRLSQEHTPQLRQVRELHCEIGSWQIELSGSVTVPRACILMSSSEPSSSGPDQFYVADHHDIARRARGLPISPQRMVDMRQWMSGRCYKCYAVALQRTQSQVREIHYFSGPILREVEPGVLIKTGYFITDWLQVKDYTWPEAQEVDWTVL